MYGMMLIIHVLHITVIGSIAVNVMKGEYKISVK